MLVELNIIATEWSNITESTAKKVTQLLNYAATHSEAITIGGELIKPEI